MTVKSSRFVIDGKTVVIVGEHEATRDKAEHYLALAEKEENNTGEPVSSVDVTVVDDEATMEINYLNGEQFDRVRRITGYLSTLPSWNNAKRFEERERVKHA